ncbi:MAG: hypothetical protein PHF84_05335, partial [bacterium]|nr:hypothetical protein [bacterium]
MKNKTSIIILSILFMSTARPLHPANKNIFQITTVKDVMKNIVEKYETIRTYSANFTLKSKIDNIETASRGV